jgi:signal peptidase I
VLARRDAWARQAHRRAERGDRVSEPTPQPSEPTPPHRRERDPVRVAARLVLTVAVRGRRTSGGPWGEAVLAEFGETRGRWQAVRWAAGGLRAVWRERRQRIRHLPRATRIGRRVAIAAVLVIVAAVPVSRFVLTPQYTAGAGMEPTFVVADRWFLDRVSFRVSGIHHGDVVAYQKPYAHVDQIRRVIGLPGDTVECRDGRVHRNGTALDEPYLTDGARTDCEPTTVPADSLYVLGDNRSISTDSRHEGTVPMSAVVGRVIDLW